jgi:hypothetical protein
MQEKKAGWYCEADSSTMTKTRAHALALEQGRVVTASSASKPEVTTLALVARQTLR